jgi:FtsX-like permease family protein
MCGAIVAASSEIPTSDVGFRRNGCIEGGAADVPCSSMSRSIRRGAIRPILRLVAARAARRRSAVALVALAIAGSIVVVGSLIGVGVLTADQATRRALGDLPAAQRLIGVHVSAEDGSGDATADQTARAALQPVLSLTDPIVSMTLVRPQRDPSRVLVLDDAKRWVELTGGRLPQPCAGGASCEVIRLSPASLPGGLGDIGTEMTLGGVRLTVVGTAHPAAGLPLDVVDANGLVLLGDGQAALLAGPGVAGLPRTTYWLAPLDPQRVRGWALADLEARIQDVQRTLAPAGRSFLVSAPDQTLETVRDRTAIAVGRLVFVSSLIVGMLLAFAAFAAAIERADVEREDRRLRTAGATGLERLAFIAGEALLPAVLGFVAGEILAALAVTALALSQGAPVDAVVWLAVVQPPAAALAALLVGLALVAVGLGIHPASGRLVSPRVIATAAIPAALVLAWDRATSGAATGSSIAANATSPGTVLLPGLLGLVVILGSLVVLPPVFRRLARASSRAPVAVRLATISIAREPLRPAATTTLLAFSVGAVVFGLVYGATLRQGATDQAAFLAGMDVRVQTLSAEGRFAQDVLPLIDQGAVGADVVVQPMIRLDGESATRRTFTLAGITADAIPDLRGWRTDFSDRSATELAAAIRQPGEWLLAGQAIPAGSREVAVTVDAAGDPIRLTLVVEASDGTFRYRRMGDLVPGRQVFHVSLFDPRETAGLAAGDPTGWQVVGLIARNGGLTGTDGPFSGNRQQADVTVTGLETLFDPAASIHLDVSGDHSTQFLRPVTRTDGLVLPAIVSPDLASDTGPDGAIDVEVGSLALRLHPVGVATHFPTLVGLGDAGLVVVDLAPLELAMNAHDPGTGVPNQLLLRTPDDARTAQVVEALSKDPFPALVVQSRPAIEAARANDPFAIGLLWGLVVGAAAGLFLSLAGILMATVAELRDERGDLWDLESQGQRPRSLVRLVVLRTALLCGIGVVSGVAIGLGLGWLAAESISEAGTGGAPVPPLLLVAPGGPILGIAAGLLVAIGVAVLLLARRHFLRPLGGPAR